MTYFSTLPNEMLLNILSYLDYNATLKHQLDTLSLLTIVSREFSINEYASLFKLRFPRYFKQELYTRDDTLYVYMDILHLFNSIDSTDEMSSLSDDQVKCYRRGLIYLVINDLVVYCEDNIHSLESIELCEYYHDLPHDELLELFIRYNNVVLLEYTFKNNWYDELNVMEHIKFYRYCVANSKDDLLGIISSYFNFSCYKDKFKFAIYSNDTNLLVDIHSNWNDIKGIFLKYVSSHVMSLKIFKYVWTVISDIENADYIIKLYDILCNEIKGGLLKKQMITLVAQHKLIQDHYLKE